MSVYIYGITFEDLVYGIPGIDSAQIGPYTEPISTTNLVAWAEDAAGLLNGALAKSGITANASLDVTAHARCKAAVKAYVTAQALGVMSVQGPVYDQARNIWEQAYRELSNNPQQLGTAYTPRVTSNIDNIDATYGPNPWSFQGNGGRGNW
jgi:hypothetical protein